MAAFPFNLTSAESLSDCRTSLPAPHFVVLNSERDLLFHVEEVPTYQLFDGYTARLIAESSELTREQLLEFDDEYWKPERLDIPQPFMQSVDDVFDAFHGKHVKDMSFTRVRKNHLEHVVCAFGDGLLEFEQEVFAMEEASGYVEGEVVIPMPILPTEDIMEAIREIRLVHGSDLTPAQDKALEQMDSAGFSDPMQVFFWSHQHEWHDYLSKFVWMIHHANERLGPSWMQRWDMFSSRARERFVFAEYSVDLLAFDCKFVNAVTCLPEDVRNYVFREFLAYGEHYEFDLLDFTRAQVKHVRWFTRVYRSGRPLHPKVFGYEPWTYGFREPKVFGPALPKDWEFMHWIRTDTWGDQWEFAENDVGFWNVVLPQDFDYLLRSQKLPPDFKWRSKNKKADIRYWQAHYQTGLFAEVEGRKKTRQERDAEQRLAYGFKRAVEEKLKPKLEREKKIRTAKREAMRRKVEYQSGFFYQPRAPPKYKWRKVSYKRHSNRMSTSYFGNYYDRWRYDESGSAFVDWKYPEPEYQGGAMWALAGAAGAFIVPKVAKFLRNTVRTVGNVNDDYQSLRELLFGFKKKMVKRSRGLLWIIPTFALVRFAIASVPGVSSIALTAISGLLAVLAGPPLWQYVSQFFPGGDVTVEQSVDLSWAPNLLSALTCFSVFKGKLDQRTVGEFAKRIGSYDRMTGGWESFLAWACKGVEEIVNFMRERFSMQRVKVFKDHSGPLKDWLRAVDEVCMSESTQPELEVEKVSYMAKLVREGYVFKSIYQTTKSSKMVEDALAKIATALAPYQGTLNAKNNFRQEPIFCLLRGPPGVGKTILAMPIVGTVLKLSGIVEGNAERVIENIWAKGVSEYWNSYAGQAAVIMDDAFQMRAMPGEIDNDYMNVIRMIGTWSFPLNFADLASKGKIFFSSKMLFGTTNITSLRVEAEKVIIEPSAVLRRITYGYELVLDGGYKTREGTLDWDSFAEEYAKCTPGSGLDSFPFHIWRVSRYDFSTGTRFGDLIPLRDLVEEMAKELKKRFLEHEVGEKVLKSYLDGITPMKNEDIYHMPEIEPERTERQYEVGEQSTMTDDTGREVPFEGYRHGPGFPFVGYVNPMFKYNPTSGKTEPAGFKFSSSDFDKNMHHEVKHYERMVGVFLTFLGGALVPMMAALVLYDMFKAVAGLFMATFLGMLRTFASMARGLIDRLKGPKKKEGDHYQSNRPLTSGRRTRPEDNRLHSGDWAVHDNVYNNTYKMFVTDATGLKPMGQVLFITDRMALLPRHYSTRLADGQSAGALTSDSVLTFVHAGQARHNFKLRLEDFLTYERFAVVASDADFVVFPTVRAHAAIIRNFMMEKDLSYVGGKAVRIERAAFTVKDDDISVYRDVYTHKDVKIETRPLGGKVNLERYVMYDRALTVEGDCGAPVCILDNAPFQGRSVLGLHVAGNSYHRLGFSNIVTQEMVEAAMARLNIIRDKAREDLEDRGVEYESSALLPFPNPGSFINIGVLKKPVTICPVTSYETTPLYGLFGEHPHRPAPLGPVMRDGQLVYPMVNAVSPYSTPLYIIPDTEVLVDSVYIAMKPFNDMSRNFSRRILDFDEAVLGCPYEKFRSIPRGTAAGFPYVYDVRGGKKEFFGTGVNYDLTGPRARELRERVEHIIDQAKQNVRLGHVFVDFLKDELRSKEKVEKVATRLISSAPLDYTIAWRMYFGAYSMAMFRYNTKSGMCPGINTYTDWSVLADHLKSKGGLVFDGDFRAFDSSELPSVMNELLDEVNRWYDDGPENARVRAVLWCDLVHSRHVGGLGNNQRFLYQWNKSLPSGHPFTTVVNSMYCLTVLVHTWVKVVGDPGSFWDHASPAVYGDDNVCGVSKHYAGIYNASAVAKVADEVFHMQYTSASKVGELTPLTDFWKLTFLKRGFVCERGNWLCPLNPESFLYTCYWVKDKRREDEILREVLENTLCELSMHDPEKWVEYQPLVLKGFEQLGLTPKLNPTRASYLREILSRKDNWY